MEKEQIIEAIRNATNGAFINGSCLSTLMGWQQKYDEQGRPLRADPNYKDSTITIADEIYPMTRHGWYAYIWKPNSRGNYMFVVRRRDFDINPYLIAKVDLRPDYAKEYEENKKKQSD